MPRKVFSPVLVRLALVALFAAAAGFELLMQPAGNSPGVAAWAVFALAGPSLATVLLCRRLSVPLVFLCALGAQMAVHRYGWTGPLNRALIGPDALVALAAALQALAGAALLRRRTGLPVMLNRQRDLASAMVLAGPVALLIGLGGTMAAGWLSGVPLTWRTFAQLVTGCFVGSASISIFVPIALLHPWRDHGLAYWKGAELPRFLPRSVLSVTLTLVVTVLLWAVATLVIFQHNRDLFLSRVNDDTRALEQRMTHFEDALAGGAALFRASTDVTRTDWKNYVAAVLPHGHFSGAQGLGFVQPVQRANLPAYLNALQVGGQMDIHVHPGSLDPVLFIVRYMQPGPALGYSEGLNIAADPIMRQAAEQARDLGRAVVTGPVPGPRGASFAIFYPVYETGAPAATVVQRRAALEGWIFSPVDAAHLMSDLGNAPGGAIRGVLYQGGTPLRGQPVYAAPAALRPGFHPQFSAVRRLDLFGKTWTIVWQSTLAFENGLHTLGPALLLIVAMAFTMLLSALLLTTARRDELVRDTVARKTREIAAQEAQTRSIIDTAVVMIALLDGDGVILTANDAVARLFGYRPGALEGMHFTELLSGETEEYFGRSSDPLDITGFRGIVKTRSRNGAPLALDIQIRAWLTDGDQRRYTVVMRNVGERLRIEAQLRDTQYRLDVALKGANIGVFDVDLVTGTSVVSDTWKQLLGFAPTARLDSQIEWRGRVHPDDRAAVDASDQACIDGQIDRSVTEYRMRTVDGHWRWMRAHAVVAERDEAGRALRLVGVQMDITEQKMLDQAKSEFVSTVSHELRTPLTSINGSLGLVLNTSKEGDIPDRALHLLKIAQKNCDRLIPLVNDILDLEKVASGQTKFSFTREDVGALIDRAIADNKPYADAYDVTLHLIEREENLFAQVDVNRFLQVMANLLSNASKFSYAKGSVAVSLRLEDGMVRVAVIDHGKGIPASFRDRVFRPFSQADSSATREKGGTGLGLNITRQIVERMGGRIGFVSEPDRRTEFWFTLPLDTGARDTVARPESAQDAETAKPGAAAADPAADAAEAADCPLILHVENDTDFAEIVAASFGDLARLLHLTRNDALPPRIAGQRFDLVILDSAQPTGPDARLIDTVLRHQPGVPIISLTASDKAETDTRVHATIIKSRARFDEIVSQCIGAVRGGAPDEENRDALVR